jgi:hypothetical protein
MQSFYDPKFYIHYTSFLPSYAAEKVPELALPHGILVLKLLALAALLRQRPLKLRGLLRKLFAF